MATLIPSMGSMDSKGNCGLLGCDVGSGQVAAKVAISSQPVASAAEGAVFDSDGGSAWSMAGGGSFIDTVATETVDAEGSVAPSSCLTSGTLAKPLPISSWDVADAVKIVGECTRSVAVICSLAAV